MLDDQCASAALYRILAIAHANAVMAITKHASPLDLVAHAIGWQHLIFFKTKRRPARGAFPQPNGSN
jgi:hypothetical protein